MKENFTTAVVVYKIHINTPHRHLAKLFIKDVPEGTSPQELKDIITENGYVFEEFNIPWANHYISLDYKEADVLVIGAFKRKDVEAVSWSQLIVNSERTGFN